MPNGLTLEIDMSSARIARLRQQFKLLPRVLFELGQIEFEARLKSAIANFRHGFHVLGQLLEIKTEPFQLVTDVNSFVDAMDQNIPLIYQLHQEQSFKGLFTQVFIGDEAEQHALSEYKERIQTQSKTEVIDSQFIHFIKEMRIVSLNEFIGDDGDSRNLGRGRIVFAGNPDRFKIFYSTHDRFKVMVDSKEITIVPSHKAQAGEMIDSLNQFVSSAILAQWSTLSDEDKLFFARDIGRYLKLIFPINGEADQIDDLTYASESKVSWYQKISLPVLGAYIAEIFNRFRPAIRRAIEASA